MQLDLGLAKSFTWKFTIAEVTKPIIGADFLRYFGLLVDVGRKRLMDAETFLTVPASYRRSAVSKLCVLVHTDQYSDILNEFSEVTLPCIKKCRLQGKVEHHIDTRCDRPVFARPRRLSPDKHSVAKEEIQKLLEMNIIRPSNSPWSSPLHMVAKPSGGWRVCGDYRALNAVSEDDRYPMPHLQDFAINLEGKNIFSKIDLVRAYNQVPMNAADIAKTAVVTPFGLFEYFRMPFGLKNAAHPLYDLVNVKDDEFEATWTAVHEDHFQRSKLALAAATGLAYPSATAETSINTDASDTAVGAVLQQCLHGVWTPISFISRKLLPAEKTYSTFDKELVAIYLAVKKFRYFVEGRKFAIFTDHKPLTFVFNKVSDKWSPRQQRHLCFVSEITTDIRYVPGPDNVVADALSTAPPQ